MTGPLTPPTNDAQTSDVKTWAVRIAERWRACVEAIIDVGRLLTEAKASLAHGEFGRMIETDLPFSASTAQRLMAIARDGRLSNAAHVQQLPASWGTLYELTQLSDDAFETAIAKKIIRPDMERKEIAEFAKPNGCRAIMGSRHEPDDSLDYFPTPPWATRALVEHVFVHLCCAQHCKRQTAWEPACGEGHIAEVLGEYFKAVFATDIHDYGYGHVRNCDFTTVAKQQHPPDWIITNPPFGDLALPFVLNALQIAVTGVAMFFRTQWAVEGIERYETIFRDRPPTLCAYFVERVNLCKGRWDPDGTTATAYCWLVWIKGAAPRAPFWIPPGQRDALTKPDDVARFTAHPVMKRSADDAMGEMAR